jgi:hypothetical protein
VTNPDARFAAFMAVDALTLPNAIRPQSMISKDASDWNQSMV